MMWGRNAQGLRAGSSPRAIWLAVSFVSATFVAISTVLLPAVAATSFELTPSAINAEVGTHFSKYETFTANFTPSTFTVTPVEQSGVTFDVETMLVAGTPTQPGTLDFQVAASDGSVTETATVSISVSCPAPIRVSGDTADVCLPQYADVSLEPPALPEVGPGSGFFGPMLLSLPPTKSGGDPHIAYSTQADGCAACHRTHADTSEMFSTKTVLSHAVDCLSCHDGSGADNDVASEYASASANETTTRSYYSHDALAVNTGHVAASSDDEGGSVATNEFFGVANRHSDCVDCHNPHAVSGLVASVQRTSAGESIGWSLSSRMQSASVATAATDTSTAFVSHATTDANFEYELCLKCHSDFTKIAAKNPSAPSRDWLDKSAEINPATAGNGSFHPIMAKGTNLTDTMTASLTGASTYRLWTFAATDTIRCTNCHANGAVAGGADQTLATHASPNRGILIKPYRDRLLLTTGEAGSTSRFELCFTCHTDVPFKQQTSSGTAFRYHYLHTTGIGGSGNYLTGSIDQDGAGNGDALCSECHFRLHSTVNQVAGQTINGSRLVNFAPNVQTSGGVIAWTPRNGRTAGSCTVRCHGQDHQGTSY